MTILDKTCGIILKRKWILILIFFCLTALTFMSMRLNTPGYWMGSSTIQLSMLYSKARGGEVITPVSSILTKIRMKYGNVEFEKVGESIIKIQYLDKDREQGLKNLQEITDIVMKYDANYTSKVSPLGDTVQFEEAELLAAPEMKSLRPSYLQKEKLLWGALTLIVLFLISAGTLVLIELSKSSEKGK